MRSRIGAAFVAAVLSALVAAGLWATTASAPAAASSGTRSGVYCSSSDPGCVDAFATWRGKPVQAVGTYLGDDSWSSIEAPDLWLVPWTTNPYKGVVVITVPMLPTTGDPGDPTPTLAEGATGAYDSHFVTLATRLVGAGLGNAVIRLGHEFNGNWYPWAARSDPTSYIAYWQHAVTAMRSVPGAAFSFDWNVNDDVVTWDARTAYPGDAYVDSVGVDVYDFHWGVPNQTPQQRWAYLVDPGGTYPQGLQLWAAFAASHGKPLTFGEWGLVGPGASMANGGEGGDDPYYVQQMAAWFASHDVAFEIYFDRAPADGDHVIDTGHFPLAAAAYVQAFGDPAAALGPSPLPSGQPSSTASDVSSSSAGGSSVSSSPTGALSDSPTDASSAAGPGGASSSDPGPSAPATSSAAPPSSPPSSLSSSPPAPPPSSTAAPPASSPPPGSSSPPAASSSSPAKSSSSAAANSSSPASIGAVSLVVSTSSSRTGAVALNGRTVKGSIYVVAQASGAKTVRFYIDDTGRTRAAYHTENTAPFDLAGTAGNGRANPFSTATLSTGKHTLTVVAVSGSTTKVFTATFTVTR
ncbi:MAG TPA: glycosyl hydrolase [Actinomycetes bacterium]|nr:glycosyl hydrolase [Actinomycetes bacterium]